MVSIFIYSRYVYTLYIYYMCAVQCIHYNILYICVIGGKWEHNIENNKQPLFIYELFNYTDDDDV